MTLDEYQRDAKAFARYPTKLGLHYCCIALAGEVGELCNEFNKELRDAVSRRDEMVDEIGDVLWYVSAVCNELGVSLDAIANQNLEKLCQRRRESSDKQPTAS